MRTRTVYEVILRKPSEIPELGPKGVPLLTDGGDPKLIADPGRVVDMKEMGTSDLLRAFSLSGKQFTGDAAHIDTKLMALRLCLVMDGDEKISYETLQGNMLDDRFTLKELFILMAVWSRIHEPDQEDLDDLGGALRVKSGA